jgi:hypothetical protein
VADILPDSRTRGGHGSIRSPFGNQIPVYCANCGCEWGMVREDMMTFAFVLCQPCADKMGPIAHTYQEPDAVFWQRAAEAQAEASIDMNDPAALQKALDDPSSPIAKLAKEWQAHARKFT